MKQLKIKITCIKTDHTGNDDSQTFISYVQQGQQLNIDYDKLAGYKVVTLEAKEVDEKFRVTFQMFENKKGKGIEPCKYYYFENIEELAKLIKTDRFYGTYDFNYLKFQKGVNIVKVDDMYFLSPNERLQKITDFLQGVKHLIE